MNTDRGIVLSNHSAFALSRRSSLHGSILTCLLSANGGGLGQTADSAAQRAARRLHVAAHAKTVGEKHAETGLIKTALQTFAHQPE